MTTVVLNTVTRKVEVFSSARDVQARAEIADHKAAANPHPQYLADADLAEVALSSDAGDLTAGTVPDARMPDWTGYNVASRTALEAANVPAPVLELRLLGHMAAGDGGGAHYKRVASEPAHPHKILSADGTWWEELFAVDVTVNIPSDFATLQEAIDRLSKQPVRRGAKIIINIESGHALTAGLVVENGDYSRFKITSTDAEVPLDATFPTTDAVFKGVNARMPVWDVLVNCNNQVVSSAEAAAGAIIVQDSSTLNLEAGSGAKNVGGIGIFVWDNSRVFADAGTIFSGCSSYAALISQMSDALLPEADFTNSSNADAAVYVSRVCRLSAIGGDFSGAAARGLLVRRSWALIIPSDRSTRFDNCGGYAIEATQGSTVIGHYRDRPVVINNCANGIFVDGASTVDFRLGEINTVTGNAFTVERASSLNAQSASALNVGGNILHVSGASKAHIRSMIANGAAGYAVLATQGSMVSASQANFSSNGGPNAVHSGTGAHVDVSGADISTYAGTGVELNVDGGGTISAKGATYSGSNQTSNIVTAAGIVYDTADDNYPLEGSNSNGSYIKFADGTLVCHHAQKATFHSATRLRCAWTFPHAFASESGFSWSAVIQNQSPARVEEGIGGERPWRLPCQDSHLNSVININLDDPAGGLVSGDFVWMSLTAVGRWF